MRELLINELLPEEAAMAVDFLNKNSTPSLVDGMFWLQVPEELYSEIQQSHETCGPFIFAVEKGDDFVSFELLVRNQGNLHCQCISYADSRQRAFLLDFYDKLISHTFTTNR